MLLNNIEHPLFFLTQNTSYMCYGFLEPTFMDLLSRTLPVILSTSTPEIIQVIVSVSSMFMATLQPERQLRDRQSYSPSGCFFFLFINYLFFSCKQVDTFILNFERTREVRLTHTDVINLNRQALLCHLSYFCKQYAAYIRR